MSCTCPVKATKSVQSHVLMLYKPLAFEDPRGPSKKYTRAWEITHQVSSLIIPGILGTGELGMLVSLDKHQTVEDDGSRVDSLIAVERVVRAAAGGARGAAGEREREREVYRGAVEVRRALVASLAALARWRSSALAEDCCHVSQTFFQPEARRPRRSFFARLALLPVI